MTPEFIALCSLATRANARLRQCDESEPVRTFTDENDRFSFEVRSSSGTIRQRRVATSPTEWLDWLVHEQCRAVSLTLAVPDQIELASCHTLRRERYGTNTVAFLTLTFAQKTMVWTNTSEAIGPPATRARVWRYVGREGDVAPPTSDGVSPAKTQLLIALDRARRLATIEPVLDHWIERFDRASRALRSHSPLQDVPEAARYPSIVGHSAGAWVRGWMRI